MHVKTQKWQKRFDNKFMYIAWALDRAGVVKPGEEHLEDIKSFITSLLEERDREIFALKSDIAHAIGYCRGLGKPESYLEKRYSDLLEEKK